MKPKSEETSVRHAQYAPFEEQGADLENVDALTELIQDDMDKKRNGFRDLVETILYCSIVVGITLVLLFFVIQPIEVEGTSMCGTLQDRDIVLTLKLGCDVEHLERYDIVIFDPNNGEEVNYVKRIIGLPGEVIYISDEGEIHVADSYDQTTGIYENDRVLSDDPMKEKNTKPLEISFATVNEPVILGEDEYFVLGDNRGNSKDSRVHSVGAISIEQIQGRVVFRLLPLSDLGRIR